MIDAYEIDPLEDTRWVAFLNRQPSAAVFHSSEWLGAIQKTYGYKVSAVTTSRPGEALTNALVFCRVHSWLTGNRMVSVPFSDHCSPLCETGEEVRILLARMKRECDRGVEKYLEIRSGADDVEGLTHSASFCLHRIDLRPKLSELFQSLHENCIRRKIARAQRERVIYEEGNSEDLLRKFYQLTVLTRRRHKLPPQPLLWFRNLIAAMGDKLKIRLASSPDGRPAAGILTLRYKTTMTYKYGCSDSRFHKLGPMQLLLWHAIQEAKDSGLLEFDLGRTNLDNKGLLTFKDRWGGVRSNLAYLRYPALRAQRATESASVGVAQSLFALAPDAVLLTAGNLLYPHVD